MRGGRTRRTNGESRMPVTLVLGGARSGKSRYAEGLIEASRFSPVYIATAEAGDAEMRERILRHRERRGDRWRTLEVPLEVAAALAAEAGPGKAVLVDCLTLWLSNLMAAGRDVEAQTERLLGTLAAAPGMVVLVSNEVGLGIVPENALARRFRDAAGRLNQSVAAQADQVVLVVAGLTLALKGRAG